MATHRIDGSVTPKDRQKIIDEFNDLSEDNMGPTICLLTTKACGCGITLTGNVESPSVVLNRFLNIAFPYFRNSKVRIEW